MRSLHLALPLALVFGLAGVANRASAQYDGEITAPQPPPELPVYEQPPLPAPGYIWTPGYWAYGADGYYWVPGAWFEPPQPGLLWTPGYWGWRDGRYVFNPGYWGPEVGFYGGIDYGFGYTGEGYLGGYWRGRVFSYNRDVNNFGGVLVTNVYVRPVARVSVNRVSFNGGQGGVARQPRPEELAASHAPHVHATPAQVGLVETVQGNRNFLATANHGRPPVMAVARPEEAVRGGAGFALRPPPPVQAPRPPQGALAPRPPGMMEPPIRPLPPSQYRPGPVQGFARPPEGFARPPGGGLAPRPAPAPGAPHPGEREEPPPKG